MYYKIIFAVHYARGLGQLSCDLYHIGHVGYPSHQIALTTYTQEKKYGTQRRFRHCLTSIFATLKRPSICWVFLFPR
jgi:hypothetical protein